MRTGPSPQCCNHGTPQSHRKQTRACDFCRRRKTKCQRDNQESTDGAGSSKLDQRCYNCKISGIECTYEVDAKPRGYTMSHAEYLERRQEQLEYALAQLCPSIDVSREIGPPVVGWRDDVPVSTRRKRLVHFDHGTGVGLGVPLALRPTPSSASRTAAASTHGSRASASSPQTTPVDFERWRDQPPPLDDDNDSTASSDNEYCNRRPFPLGKPRTSDWSVVTPRFHGKSSCFSLVGVNRELRFTGKDRKVKANPVGRDSIRVVESKLGHKSKIVNAPKEASSKLTFPPDDLLNTLVDLYFERVNVIRPLLHQPTIRADIAKRYHVENFNFGCVVLAVCAVASRYCDDSRVRAKLANQDDHYDSGSQRASPGLDSWVDDDEAFAHSDFYEDAPLCSAGWKYFDRIERFMRSDAYPMPTLDVMTLAEVQTTCLMYQFTLGQSDYARGWSMVGVAIRRAQDLGAHIKKRYSHAERSLEGELWKRALWCLILADRDAGLCGRTGFSCAEYFDMRLPLEVDDEYYTCDENGNNAAFLEQPAGKPSIISAFNAHLKLSVIYEFATSHLHPVDESRLPGGFVAFDVVTYLERAMAEWLKTFPPHLRSDAIQDNPVWRMQSTILDLKYQLLRMHIYKCFVPGEKLRRPLPGSGLPGSSRASAAPTSRTCTKIPTASDARSICAASARVIATFLRDTVAQGAQLCDVPAFVAAASLGGWFLQGAKAGRAKSRQVLPALDGGALRVSGITEDEAFEVCTDFLRGLRERWSCAEAIRRALVPGSDGSRGSTPPTTLSESGSSSGSQSDPWRARESHAYAAGPALLETTGPGSFASSQSPPSLQPLMYDGNKHQWVPQGPLVEACAFDASLPPTSTLQGGPAGDFQQLSTLSHASSDVQNGYHDSYNEMWVRHTGGPYFEAPPRSAHHDVVLAHQYASAPPDWKTAPMPPYPDAPQPTDNVLYPATHSDPHSLGHHVPHAAGPVAAHHGHYDYQNGMLDAARHHHAYDGSRRPASEYEHLLPAAQTHFAPLPPQGGAYAPGPYAEPPRHNLHDSSSWDR